MPGRRTHYHVFMGPAGIVPMQSAQFADYDESIRKFLSLGRATFGVASPWKDSLTYKNVLVASEFGAAERLTVGLPTLCVQWYRCADACFSPNWN